MKTFYRCQVCNEEFGTPIEVDCPVCGAGPMHHKEIRGSESETSYRCQVCNEEFGIPIEIDCPACGAGPVHHEEISPKR